LLDLHERLCKLHPLAVQTDPELEVSLAGSAEPGALDHVAAPALKQPIPTQPPSPGGPPSISSRTKRKMNEIKIEIENKIKIESESGID
jgi:hypothetical protein